MFEYRDGNKKDTSISSKKIHNLLQGWQKAGFYS